MSNYVYLYTTKLRDNNVNEILLLYRFKILANFIQT